MAPSINLLALFVTTGIPFVDTNFRLNTWIDHKDLLFRNGLSKLVTWFLLGDIQLASIWTHPGVRRFTHVQSFHVSDSILSHQRLFSRSPRTLWNVPVCCLLAYILTGHRNGSAMTSKLLYHAVILPQRRSSDTGDSNVSAIPRSDDF